MSWFILIFIFFRFLFYSLNLLFFIFWVYFQRFWFIGITLSLNFNIWLLFLVSFLSKVVFKESFLMRFQVLTLFYLSVSQLFNNLFDYPLVYFFRLHITIKILIRIPLRIWRTQVLYLFFGLFKNIHEFISIQYEKLIEWFSIFFLGCFAFLVEEFGISSQKFLNEWWDFSYWLEWIIYGFECLPWTCAFLSVFFLIVWTLFIPFLVIRSRLIEVFVSDKYFLSLHLKKI